MSAEPTQTQEVLNQQVSQQQAVNPQIESGEQTSSAQFANKEEQIPQENNIPQVQTETISEPVQQQKYYLLFVKTPFSSLMNRKVPLDFSIFPSATIGREQDNDIVALDPRVSRRHAVIYLEGGELYIEDLNTTYGTFVYDGKTFQQVKGKQKISPGSIIKLGKDTVLKLVNE